MVQYELLICLLGLSMTPLVDGCFAAGVGCCGPQLPAPVCSGGCGGAGYACGPYGCYNRMRARASKTLKIEGLEENIEDSQSSTMFSKPFTPDEKFMSCCIDRHLPDACLDKCNFASYNRNALQNMYFRLDSCPMQAAADLQFCAAQGRDHRECCYRNGVGMTLAGQKCLTFCDQRPGNVTQLDFSYMACFDKFENIKGCFWHDIIQRQRREQHDNSRV